MDNPKCTWRGDLVKDRHDHLGDHNSQCLTVACGTEVSENIYLASSIKGCMRARMKVAGPTHPDSSIEILAVVDSGAAWTALHVNEATRMGITKFSDTRMKFHGVTGAALHVLGSCELTITMGDVHFKTLAFVFNDLAAPMLLGTNTLVSRGIVIDACNMPRIFTTPLFGALLVSKVPNASDGA